MTYAIATETLAADYLRGVPVVRLVRRHKMTESAIYRRFKKSNVPRYRSRSVPQIVAADAMRRRVHRWRTASALLAAGPSVEKIMDRLANGLRESADADGPKLKEKCDVSPR